MAFFAPKLDIALMTPLPWPAAPYDLIILRVHWPISEEEQKVFCFCTANVHCHFGSKDLCYWFHT